MVEHHRPGYHLVQIHPKQMAILHLRRYSLIHNNFVKKVGNFWSKHQNVDAYGYGFVDTVEKHRLKMPHLGSLTTNLDLGLKVEKCKVKDLKKLVCATEPCAMSVINQNKTSWVLFSHPGFQLILWK